MTARGLSSSYRYDSSLGIGSIPDLCMWPLAYMARIEDRSVIDLGPLIIWTIPDNVIVILITGPKAVFTLQST